MTLRHVYVNRWKAQFLLPLKVNKMDKTFVHVCSLKGAGRSGCSAFVCDVLGYLQVSNRLLPVEPSVHLKDQSKLWSWQFSEFRLWECLTAPLQTRAQQKNGDEPKASPPSSSSSWAAAAGAGVPAGRGGGASVKPQVSSEKHLSRQRAPLHFPGWLAAVLFRRYSSVRTRTSCFFFFFSYSESESVSDYRNI